MYLRIASICLWGFFLSFAAIEKPLPLIAVSTLEGVGVDSVLVRMSTDRLRSELIKSGEFRVLERNQMDAILSEQAFQQSGCVAAECAVQMGQLLGADFVISGSMGRVQNFVSLSLKFASVETGEIKYSVDQTNPFSVNDILDGIIPSLAVKMTKAFLGTAGTSATSIGMAEIFVETNPTGAQVWLDDELQNGVTPITITRLKAGPHTLRARRGEQGASLIVNLEPNGLEKLQLNLVELKSSLRIKTEPAGCGILLNGKYFGAQTPYLFRELSLGSHSVGLQCKGWLPENHEVELKFGEQSELSLRLKPAGVLSIKSDLKPYSVMIDSIKMGAWGKDTSLNLIPGHHQLRIQGLPFDGLVFETMEKSVHLAAGEEFQIRYLGNLDSTFIAERSMKRKWIARAISAALFVGGITGVVINQREHDRLYKLYNKSENQEQFDDRWDEAEKSKVRRNVSATIAMLGAIGFGVSYAF